jgi:uncharacterized protein YndB with AHSA1/START domain
VGFEKVSHHGCRNQEPELLHIGEATYDLTKENAMNASDRTGKARSPAALGSPDAEPRSSAALRRSTGRDRDEWFALLDTWGAGGRPYREIADWLTGEHGVSSWWAQKLIVEYEQARGLRDAGVRPDGTFAGGASKTIAVPVKRVFDAFVDPGLRERWLPGVVLRERTSQAGRSARFDWDDAASRVNVTFAALSDAKSQVAIEHDHLPDARAAAERKVFWRERLTTLKALLEA